MVGRASPGGLDLFTEEVADLFALLPLFPELGRPYPHPQIPLLRRALLRATKHHVYYQYDKKAVTVISVWGAVRGRGPRLRAP